MLETVIFSLIKGLPFSIKKKLIDENMCPKKALANLKTSLIGVNSKTGFMVDVHLFIYYSNCYLNDRR